MGPESAPGAAEKFQAGGGHRSPKRGINLEKRKVTITIAGKPFSLMSDDSDAYIAALEQRINAVMQETAGFSGSSYNNALLAALSLTDQLLRMEQKGSRKTVPKPPAKENGQVSVWDLLDD